MFKTNLQSNFYCVMYIRFYILIRKHCQNHKGFFSHWCFITSPYLVQNDPVPNVFPAPLLPTFIPSSCSGSLLSCGVFVHPRKTWKDKQHKTLLTLPWDGLAVGSWWFGNAVTDSTWQRCTRLGSGRQSVSGVWLFQFSLCPRKLCQGSPRGVCYWSAERLQGHTLWKRMLA